MTGQYVGVKDEVVTGSYDCSWIRKCVIVHVDEYCFVGVFSADSTKNGSDTLCGIAPIRKKIGYDTNNFREKFVERS